MILMGIKLRIGNRNYKMGGLRIPKKDKTHLT
jgi:hypothetical protein